MASAKHIESAREKLLDKGKHCSLLTLPLRSFSFVGERGSGCLTVQHSCLLLGIIAWFSFTVHSTSWIRLISLYSISCLFKTAISWAKNITKHNTHSHIKTRPNLLLFRNLLFWKVFFPVWHWRSQPSGVPRHKALPSSLWSPGSCTPNARIEVRVSSGGACTDLASSETLNKRQRQHFHYTEGWSTS